MHCEMFGQSWLWAGQYRSSDKSIGADWRQIRMQVPALLADIAYQVEHRVDAVDQIAIRFHHRLVTIHPFPNGNGRHARLIADVLIEQLGKPCFSWGGSSSLVDASALRQQYIAAL
jgi:Fic-DOC domain mobile mystery protein B